MTTNIVEYINGVLKGARMLLITSLVEVTFYRCVTYFEKRRAKIRAQIANGDMYTTYAMTKVANYEAKASGHFVSIFHRENEMFDVITATHGFHMDKRNNKQTVNLKDGKCSCNKWQSIGIPCSYVLVVYPHARIDSWWILFCRQVK